MSVQAWNIFAKIREVDAVFATQPNLQRRVREVHPELAFAALNDGRTMENPKKTRAGRDERLRTLSQHFGDAFVTMMGTWWGDLLVALRRHTATRGAGES